MSDLYKAMFEAQKTINERLREEILQSESARRELVTEKALLQDNMSHLQLHYNGKVGDAERAYMLLQNHSQQVAQMNEGLQIENSLLGAQVFLQDREIRALSSGIDDLTMVMTQIQAAHQEGTASAETERRALRAKFVERTVADAELRDALRAKTRKAKEQLKAETQRANELAAQAKAVQEELDKLRPKAEHWRGNLATVSKQLEAKTAEATRLQADLEEKTKALLASKEEAEASAAALRKRQAREEKKAAKGAALPEQEAAVVVMEETPAEEKETKEEAPIADARAKEVAEKVKARRKERAEAQRKEARAEAGANIMCALDYMHVKMCTQKAQQNEENKGRVRRSMKYVAKRSAVRVDQLVKEVDDALDLRTSVTKAAAEGVNTEEAYELFAWIMKECGVDE